MIVTLFLPVIGTKKPPSSSEDGLTLFQEIGKDLAPF